MTLAEQMEGDLRHAAVNLSIGAAYCALSQPEKKALQEYATLMREAADAFREQNEALRRYTAPRPLEEWHDDDGPVLWWHENAGEPPFAGTPNDSDWPGNVFFTHWTPIPNPTFPTRTPGHGGRNGE